MVETRSSKRTKTSKEEVEIEDNKNNADAMDDHDAMDAATNAPDPIVSRVLALLDTPQFPLMEFFCEPLDLVRLLFLCKAFRKAAIQKLIKIQQRPAVQWRQQLFHNFLEFPILSGYQGEGHPRWVYRGMSPSEARGKLCGPLRLEAIQNGAEYFKKRFVILDYVQKDDCNQECVVAVFDEKGSLHKVYKLESRRDMTASPYPKSKRKGMHPLCSRLMLFESELFNHRKRDWLNRPSFDRSLFHLEGARKFHHIDHTFMQLIDDCNNSDQFSPTEVIFVLWKALSAEPDIIRDYMCYYFPDKFDYELRRWPSALAYSNEDNVHPMANLIHEKIEIWSSMDYM